MTGYAAPLLDAKDIWGQNVFAPVIKTACSSDGQCWGWLPKSETYDSTVIVSEQDSDISRWCTHTYIIFFFLSLVKSYFAYFTRVLFTINSLIKITVCHTFLIINNIFICQMSFRIWQIAISASNYKPGIRNHVKIVER